MAVIIAYHQGACYVEGEKKNERQKEKNVLQWKKDDVITIYVPFYSCVL